MSQNDKILKHLQEGKSLTPIDALNQFGCFRLSARIKDLKQDGYEIKTDIIDNGEKRYASYKLVQ